MGALAGRVAIVTGGGQGVGRGIALALARRGAAVAITGRTEATLAGTAKEIEALGVPASAHVCDGNDGAAIAATVEAAAERHGRIAILVNNAQQVPLGRLLDVSDEDFLTGFTSGPLAAFRFMRA
ncbi:MAG TPA: SDR family NAD(P)-dependent oxidoreductase, partial [Sphingomonas sp.]|nr:SDR family NAD(P)-dependent oxidoreductase [Sphingomonas sp.]